MRSPSEDRDERRLAHIDYKWIALSNTTLGTLMAALNSSIILIALPAIFRGMQVDPLAPGESPYLLWSLLGYLVVTATLLVTCGRISDIFGRVRLYNAGFAVFTLGSVLLFLIRGSGNTAALQLVLYRLVQGVGAAFLFANSTAILIDAFPPTQRGLAIGINQVAAIGGSFVGLLLGGLLAEINWRAVFLVSVPFGLIGTVWAYLMLHETAPRRGGQRIDVAGNLLFAGGLVVLMIALTYGLEPYGADAMGWRSPFVVGGIVAGLALLAAFVVVEQRVPDPLFRLDLFRIRQFTMGNIANFLASLARGGLQFILIIWLQGIWLPLHGYRFEETPLWAGIYMLPLTAGFLAFGPASGFLSDRIGARVLATTGVVVAAIAFVGLLLLPIDFQFAIFALLIFTAGAGLGMFSAPNTAALMNAVPPPDRGVASGMNATTMNVGSTLSITVIFSLVTLGLASQLPRALTTGLTAAGISQDVAARVAALPPTGALFAAFLGYNPMGTLLPATVLDQLPAATRDLVLGKTFFPELMTGPMQNGMQIAFAVSALCCVAAAFVSWLRGAPVIARDVSAAEVPRPLAGTGAEALPSPGSD
jgi:MFS family permease